MNTTLIIEERAPFAEGADFGPVGAYERIKGRVRFAIDPRLPANQHIVDLTLAPADDRGLVEYSTEFFIIKPVDMSRGNRRLLYDVNNRGNKRALQFFNDAPPTNDPRTAQDAGHGFLMRRGYTVVWCGWQGDLLPGDGRLTMALPVATRPDGAVTGPFRAEFIIEQPGVTTVSLGGHDYIRPCPSVDLNTETATLTRRRLEQDTRQPVAASDWQFAAADAAGNIMPSATRCYLPEGFRPGWIYELIYTAKDPLVMGLGLCRGARPHRLPAPCRRGCRGTGQSAAGRGAGHRESLRLGALPERPLPARVRLRRVQCRGGRPKRLRRRVLPRGRRRTAAAQLPLRAARPLSAPARRPPLPVGGVPVRLRPHRGPVHRNAGLGPEASGHRPPRHPHPDRHRVLAAARLAGAHRPPRQRPPGAREHPRLPARLIAAQRRGRRPRRRGAAISAESAARQSGPSRPAERPGRVGHRRRPAPREPHPDAVRRQADHRRHLPERLPGSAGLRLPRTPRAPSHPPRSELRRGRHHPRATAGRQDARICGSGAFGGRRRQRERGRAGSGSGRAPGHLPGLERAAGLGGHGGHRRQHPPLPGNGGSARRPRRTRVPPSRRVIPPGKRTWTRSGRPPPTSRSSGCSWPRTWSVAWPWRESAGMRGVEPGPRAHSRQDAGTEGDSDRLPRDVVRLPLCRGGFQTRPERIAAEIEGRRSGQHRRSRTAIPSNRCPAGTPRTRASNPAGSSIQQA